MFITGRELVSASQNVVLTVVNSLAIKQFVSNVCFS